MRDAKKVARRPDASLEGGHPGLLTAQPLCQLTATSELQLVVDAGEVTLDGLERHVEGLGDLAVRAALGGEARHAQLAGRERFDPCAPRAARPCSRGRK